MDSVDQVEHHHIVHTAVSGLSSFGFVFRPQSMIVFLEPFFRIIPTVRFGFALDIYMVAIVHPQTFGSLNTEAQRIRTGRVGIMCHDDGLSVRALDHRSHDIAQVEVDLGIRMVFTAIVHNKLM